MALLALLQFEILNRFIGDRSSEDYTASDLDTDMRSRRALFDIDDLTLDEIASGNLHLRQPFWQVRGAALPRLIP